MEYSPAHEKINSLTHAIGVLLTLVFIPPLVIQAQKEGDPLKIFGIALFGLSLFQTYLSSTLYHLTKNHRWKSYFRTWDHVSIYLLIGGSYSAFLLSFYNELDGWIFLSIHWLIVCVGVVSKLFIKNLKPVFSLILYLILGWMVVLIFNELTSNMSFFGVSAMIVGGLSYTVGVIFYLTKRIPYHHAIWHIFVLGGSSAHFLAIAENLLF